MTWHANLSVKMSGEELKPFYSPYIMDGGQNQDVIRIDEVAIEGRLCKAKCSFESYFTSPTDTSFHLSLQRSVDLITQVAIIHALKLTGHEKKEVEIWCPEINLSLVRPQRDPNDIQITMELLSRHTVPASGQRVTPRTHFKWKVQVGASDWFGTVTYVMPIG